MGRPSLRQDVQIPLEVLLDAAEVDLDTPLAQLDAGINYMDQDEALVDMCERRAHHIFRVRVSGGRECVWAASSGSCCCSCPHLATRACTRLSPATTRPWARGCAFLNSSSLSAVFRGLS